MRLGQPSGSSVRFPLNSLEFGESSRNPFVEVTNIAEYQDEHHKSNRVKSNNDTESTLEECGGKRSLTPSVAELQRLIGTSPACRMLTPYEIELLRKSKKEMAQVLREVLAGKNKTSQK